jgi:hypothetical protein
MKALFSKLLPWVIDILVALAVALINEKIGKGKYEKR